MYSAKEYVVLVSKVLVQHEFFLAAAAWSLVARPAAASSDPASRGFIIVWKSDRILDVHLEFYDLFWHTIDSIFHVEIKRWYLR